MIVGTGDEHGAAVGAGALAPGVVVDVTGTAEPVAVPSARRVLDAERLLETHAHAVEEMLLVENPGFVPAAARSGGRPPRASRRPSCSRCAAQAPPGCEGALFLPTLSGSMAPRWNDAMRGCFAGLALNHDAAHLARAVLEGCAYALRDIVDRFAALGLGGEEIRVVGGGARSPLWLQIKADVTGQPVRPVLGDCATSMGAAMLAGVAAGIFDDLEAQAAAARSSSRPSRCSRAPETADVYDQAYARYRRLFDGVEGALT